MYIDNPFRIFLKSGLFLVFLSLVSRGLAFVFDTGCKAAEFITSKCSEFKVLVTASKAFLILGSVMLFIYFLAWLKVRKYKNREYRIS